MLGMDQCFRDGQAFAECYVNRFRRFYATGRTVADTVLSLRRKLRTSGQEAVPGSFSWTWAPEHGKVQV